jgi:transposase-like protein
MKAKEFSQLLATVTRLTHYQRNQLIVVLNRDNDSLSVHEIIESKFDAKHECPHCKSRDLYRHGFAHGLQRYRCKQCEKTFNALTQTPLARLRHKGKWLNYLEQISASLTVRKSATSIGVHRNTSFRWRHRFLTLISKERADKLHGITEVDETYLLESDKGQRHLNRAPRKRGGHATKPGLSGEQVCVLVARDRATQTLDFVVGKGSITKSQVTAVLKPVLDQDVLLVTDSNLAYAAFCKTEKISHEAINLSEHQHTKGAYHLQNVNAYHSRFKGWLLRFHGVATKYLSNYLGWYHAIELHSKHPTEIWLNAALGNFQHLTVT